MNRRELINTKLLKLLLLYMFALFVFLISRTIFVLYFADDLQFTDLRVNFFTVLFNSLRFDTVVSLYGFSILLLLLLVYLFLPKRKLHKYNDFTQLFFKLYSIFLIVIFVVISTLDFFYFKTYGNHFDSLIFALKNDDTLAVLSVFWFDYPIIRIVLFWIFLWFIIKNVVLKICKYSPSLKVNSAIVNYVAFLLFISMYFVGLRGSLGMFPLKLKHSYVTDNQFLNKMTINSVFALKSVLSKGENKKRINANYLHSLQKNGYTTIEEAVKQYLEKDSLIGKRPEEFIFSTTSDKLLLKENPPNVVFILMESLGQHFFDLHTQNCNTLGALEDELPNCIVYKNMMPSGNLTINTLENLLVGAPFSPIAQSPYKNIPLSTSISIPFKKANYTTSFLYAGEYGWRDIGAYIEKQGFDKMISKKHLEIDYPNAEANPWGVHDVYLYDKIIRLLKESDSPQFIFTLTVSNHTPYKLPKSFRSKPIFVSDSILDKMKIGEEITYRSLQAYQYANNQLGHFLKRIRESDLGENTIIAITGDHNQHQGFKYDESEIFYAHAVPLILYIPDRYKPKHDIKTDIFGSHKDIFPTLFNLSLYNSTYFNTGENLFGQGDHFSINAFNFAVNKDGAVKKGKPVRYYNWTNENKTLLMPTDKNNKLDSLNHKMKAYNTVINYYIKKEFAEKK